MAFRLSGVATDMPPQISWANNDESVAEMGSSLEAEIAPQVIALEDRTITLTGTVQAQYTQWQELMQKIYTQERGAL